MSAFGDAAFEARIEGIAGEEGQDVRLASKFRMGPIVVHHGLEAGDTPYGFSRPGSGGQRSEHGSGGDVGSEEGPYSTW